MYAKRCKGKRLQEERNLFYHWENHTAHCVDGNAYGGKWSGTFDQLGRACSHRRLPFSNTLTNMVCLGNGRPTWSTVLLDSPARHHLRIRRSKFHKGILHPTWSAFSRSQTPGSKRDGRAQSRVHARRIPDTRIQFKHEQMHPTWSN